MLAAGIDPHHNMAAGPQVPPHLLAQVLPSPFRRYEELPRVGIEQAVGQPAHRPRIGMLPMGRHEQMHFRAGRGDEFRGGRVDGTVVAVFHHGNLANHIGQEILLGPVVRGISRMIATRKVSTIIIGKISVSQQDATAVQVLVEQERIAGIHFPGFLSSR